MIDFDSLRWRQNALTGRLEPNVEDVRQIEDALETTCPAAVLGKYTDTGRTYVKCRVIGEPLKVADNAVAVIRWCCGRYADDPMLGPCPTWEGDVTNDPALERMLDARRAGKLTQLTQRQIETGMRTDDRGLDPSLPSGTREVIEAVEEAGEQDG